MEPVDPWTESRGAPRKPFVVEIRARHGECFWAGLTENLSQGGVFIVTDEELDPGEEFEIELRLPGGEVVNTIVEVRWLRPPGAGGGLAPGAGVRFLELGAEHQALLQKTLVENIQEAIFIDLD